ncbi:DUF2807 domain-containing protein [Flavobacterium faecale]|uniref:DUF2807 domain-containing protein n=1 Tax=Flavobacterium faecale TaxID=1355330 RepID=A0A2S1LCW7_9FLAO|nr:head GIN domain-containing protein [Flavobacterium faecale]AWG21589.1 DUF2807 domain-containing protein [Flavobacterium faecale]
MMKNSLLMAYKIIPALFCLLLLSSCNDWFNLKSITGSGNVITENRKIDENFVGIDVSNGIDVIVKHGDNFEVIVEADDNLQDEITTTVKNGILVIDCEYNSFLDVSSKKVIVTMPKIEQLESSSASSITSEMTLKTNAIDISSSSGSSVDLKINADKLTCKASSGSDITLRGLALELEAKASSGSDIEAKDMAANKVIARSSSGSSIEVNPIVELQANASSGSSINYLKTPKKISRESSSGASIGLN